MGDHSEVRIKCIVIDDEPLALGLIESYIKKIPYLRLMGAYEDPFQALLLLKEEDIDLLYLDINMPDITGTEFFKSLKSPPQVIFITAYDQYAVQGFELQALDYLLKPVSFQRFLFASDRALEHFKVRKGAAGAETSYRPVSEKFIFVKSEHNLIKISLDDIQYVEGYKDYVKIFTSDAKPILTITTFKSLEQLLPKNFIRIHKSFIICVDKIVSLRNGKVLVKDKHIPIGESYKEVFQSRVITGRL